MIRCCASESDERSQQTGVKLDSIAEAIPTSCGAMIYNVVSTRMVGQALTYLDCVFPVDFVTVIVLVYPLES